MESLLVRSSLTKNELHLVTVLFSFQFADPKLTWPSLSMAREALSITAKETSDDVYDLSKWLSGNSTAARPELDLSCTRQVLGFTPTSDIVQRGLFCP